MTIPPSADDLGDYQSEIGWPSFARLVERHARGAT